MAFFLGAASTVMELLIPEMHLEESAKLTIAT